MSKPSDFDFYCAVALQPDVNLNVEYESEKVLAYHHTKPNWPVHIVVVPKEHIWDLRYIDDDSLLTELMLVARDLVKKYSQNYLDENGARILTNFGKFQDTPHLHFHVVCGEGINTPI